MRDAEINLVNADPENHWEAGHNFLSTLTTEERKSWTGRLPSKQDESKLIIEDTTPVAAAPTSVDWRTKGAVNPVQNQGQCGGCWAFSSSAAFEGDYFINFGTLLKFSEQQLLDCVTADGGCDGGLETDAVDYIK